MAEPTENSQKIYCKNCGYQNDWDAIWCQKCGKNIREQSNAYQNPSLRVPQMQVPQSVNNKNRKALFAGILVVILLITVIPGIFFWNQDQTEQQRQNEIAQQQKQMEQSVNGITIDLTEFSFVQETLYFEADTTFKISNNGPLAVTLDRATTTLYINGFNIQTKEFSEQVTIIPANSNTEYTAKYVTFDSDSVTKLQYLPSPHTQLKLNAMATSGTYSSAIQIWDDGDWTPKATPHPTPTATPTVAPYTNQVQVKVQYSGAWSGAYGDAGNIQSWNGNGPYSITLTRPSDSYLWIISANAQKQDGSSATLTISILRMDGTVIKSATTSTAYGVAQVSASID